MPIYQTQRDQLVAQYLQAATQKRSKDYQNLNNLSRRQPGKPILSGHHQVVTNITQGLGQPDDEFNFIKKRKESQPELFNINYYQGSSGLGVQQRQIKFGEQDIPKDPNQLAL